METMKQQLKDILLLLSWREVAHTYFTKSSSWFYHKMDGIDGNGGKGEFTKAEKAQLREALLDVSARIKAAAESISTEGER